MFSVWGSPASRPTKDIDLLGKTSNNIRGMEKIMKDACKVKVEPDGMTFDEDSVVGEPIAEDADYEGVRVTLQGALGNARVSLQIDIGFGDIVSPSPFRISYPTILDFPAPKVNGYTKRTAIAEKFQAMFKLGILNSRMKDFYDVWLMTRMLDFKGEDLVNAIQKTFKNRKTDIIARPPIFDANFCNDKNKQTQWKAFITKSKLTNAPADFCSAVADIEKFLSPVLDAILSKEPPRKLWTPSENWKG